MCIVMDYRTVTQFFGVFGCFSLLFFCIRTPFHKSIPVFNSYITGVSLIPALGLLIIVPKAGFSVVYIIDICVVYVSGFGFPSFMAIRVHIVENWFLPITMLSYPYLFVLGRMNSALSFTLVTWFRRLMYSFITALRLISSICSGT